MDYIVAERCVFLLQVDRLAAGLLALGLKPGDRVGVWGPNTYEWILTQFATAKAGVILVCFEMMSFSSTTLCRVLPNTHHVSQKQENSF